MDPIKNPFIDIQVHTSMIIILKMTIFSFLLFWTWVIFLSIFSIYGDENDVDQASPKQVFT